MIHILEINLDVDFFFPLKNLKVELLLVLKHGNTYTFFSLSISAQEAPSKSFLLHFPTCGQVQTVWNKTKISKAARE